MRLTSPRGGILANFARPGGWAFANPDSTLSFLHARGFRLKFQTLLNVDDFTGNTISQIGLSVKDGKDL